MSLDKMTLRIWTPERQAVRARADKVVAEAGNGFFCLLPRHIDFLAELVPGVLVYTDGESERYAAVDRGILVKCGLDVMVSVRNAIPGESLETLEEEVREKFRKIDRKEEEVTLAMNQLEADFIRRFLEMNQPRPGG